MLLNKVRKLWSPKRVVTSHAVVKTIRRRVARFIFSYKEEKRALQEATRWLKTGMPQSSSVTVFTDSNFLCEKGVL